MQDKIGNYLFSVEGVGVQFMIQKMNVFEQRDFITHTKAVFDEFGSVRLYTPEANAAQDYVIPLVMHEDGAGWKSLSSDYLPLFLSKHSNKPLVLMNSIFVSAMNELLGNFINTGGEESQNSAPAPVANTEASFLATVQELI